jgi:hypothetical protein
MAAPSRTQVFISYSHADAEWLTRLQIMPRPLARNHSITIWDDTRMQGGSKWREEIRQAVSLARVDVLLVSPDFLASDFIANDELPPLLQAAEEEGLTILWAAVRYSLYGETTIAAYQAANNPTSPLAALSPLEQDEELVKIAQKIRNAATRPIALRTESPPAGISPQISGGLLLPKQPFEPELILIPGGEFLMIRSGFFASMSPYPASSLCSSARPFNSSPRRVSCPRLSRPGNRRDPICRGYSRSCTRGATSSISKRRERCISEWSSGSWVMASRCPKPPTSSWSWRILSAHSWGSPTIQTCSIM